MKNSILTAAISGLFLVTAAFGASGSVERLTCDSGMGRQPQVLLAKTTSGAVGYADVLQNNTLDRYQITAVDESGSKETIKASLRVGLSMGATANSIEIVLGARGNGLLLRNIGGTQERFPLSCRPANDEEAFLCVKDGLLYEAIQIAESTWQYRASEEQPGNPRGQFLSSAKLAWAAAHQDCGE
jgi:hypothetical protein